jgi:hypothetical protein
MRADDARKKGKITPAEAKRIKRISLCIAAFVTIVLVGLFAYGIGVVDRNSKVEAAHHQYHETRGIISAEPKQVETYESGKHYLAQVTYTDWYGRSQTVLFMTTKHFKKGERDLVVISKTHAPWVAESLEEGFRNPHNPSPESTTFPGAFFGTVFGIVILIFTAVAAESRLVSSAVRKKAKKLANRPCEATPRN